MSFGSRGFNSWAFKRRQRGCLSCLLRQRGQPFDKDNTDEVVWNNWFFGAQANVYWLEVGVPVSLELAAEPGAFSVTGVAANGLYGRVLGADPASYTLSGVDAGLTTGGAAVTASVYWLQVAQSQTLTANAGAFSLSGSDASLLYGARLGADAGAFTLSGVDAGLTYGSSSATAQISWLQVAPATGLTGNSGSFLVSGSDATLTYGSVAATAQISWLQVAPGTVLTANPGSFSLTGFDATLTVGGTARALTAETGSFTVSVAPSLSDLALTADVGSFSVSGVDAGLSLGRLITADPGAFTVSGVDADLQIGGPPRLQAESGSFVVTGGNATFDGGTPTGIVEVDIGSGGLWWKRRGSQDEPATERSQPKRQKVREQAAKVIAEVAQDQVARGTLPKSVRFAEVRSQIKPLGKEAQALNWPAMYERMYQQALMDAIREELKQEDERRRRDDDDALALLLLEME